MWRRTLVTPVAAVLLALAACGGEDAHRAAYCAELESEQVRLAEILGGDPAALLGGLPLLRDVADGAPDDLTDEWQTFLGALEGLSRALESAGVEPESFSGGAPEGLDAAERKTIADAADTLASAEVVSAASGIEQHARDVCGLQLLL